MAPRRASTSWLSRATRLKRENTLHGRDAPEPRRGFLEANNERHGGGARGWGGVAAEDEEDTDDGEGDD
jgi:hypothetical protein